MTEISRTKPELDDAAGTEDVKTGRERVTKDTSNLITPGWSSNIRPKGTPSVKFDRFTIKVDAEEVLVKFLDAVPFAPFFQHWIAQEKGDIPYTCSGDGCPMCARGHKSKSSDWFNIVQLNDNESEGKAVPGPMLRVWTATSDPAEAIKEMSEGKRTSPINKDGLYFAVSKKKAATGYNTFKLARVDEAELSEDWGIPAITKDQLAGFNSKKYDSSLVKIHDVAELSEVARKYLDD